MPALPPAARMSSEPPATYNLLSTPTTGEPRRQPMTLRGVILAGGKGTRLGELTKVTNKHLLPVGPYPMVYHPLKKLVGAGIREILLVSGTEHMGDFVELLGSGKEHRCNLTYRVQDEAGGIAQALGLAELVCQGVQSLVILGDNIFLDGLGSMMKDAYKQHDH